MARKKTTTKVKPISQRKERLNNPVYEDPILPFHETFPITLRHFEGKDEKVCYFQCQEHLNKYVARNGLKPKDYKQSKTQPKVKNILELLEEI
jgi:hypothetical protein